ncbi:alpha 1,2-mannosyltransferase 2.4.1 [Tulasnella sp. 417]|nr:alpha 1,2-mannosyltransferase 2.4.1 [Tulasnella sp. 417]
MLSPARYLLVVLLSLIGVHFLLTITHEQYGNAVNFSHLKDKLSCSAPHETVQPESLVGSEFHNTTQRKANAAFVILARNSELNGVLESIKMMEDRFNRKFGYPYVFLNEQPFTSDFIKYTSDIISTKAEYGVIPAEHWYQPEWIDEERATRGRQLLQQKQIGDLNFWRSPAYMAFFEHLEKAGGFYYERWGDAPVHSIGAALLARRDQLHFFNDIGYKHEPFMHCPSGAAHTKGKCWCDQKESFDYDGYSCHVKYERTMMPSTPVPDPLS